jgi:type I restriction enzyme M protein
MADGVSQTTNMEQELKDVTQATRRRALTVAEILRGSEYSLTLFSAEEVAALEIFEKNGKPYLTCWCTAKPRPAKPEEIVRQLYLRKLTEEYGYPRDRIALEKESTQ